MNLPITSRVKRSPLLSQAAGAIEVGDDDQAKGFYESQGEDVKSTKTVTQGPTESFTGTKATGEAEKKWAKQNEYCKGKPVGTPGCSGFHKFEGTGTVVEETVVKGEKEMGEVPIRVAQKGDVMEPWQISRMQRSIKKEQKQIRKSKLKQRPDGVSRRDWKRQVRAEENAAEQKEFQALADRNAKSRASGKRGGSRDVAGFDRAKTVGEDSEKVQVTKAQKAAELAANKNKKEEKKKSPNEMRPTSPAKKALKGSQNQLPQHLQAAIKAAPGKMNGSPYKMKGSMFKKRY